MKWDQIYKLPWPVEELWLSILMETELQVITTWHSSPVSSLLVPSGPKPAYIDTMPPLFVISLVDSWSTCSFHSIVLSNVNLISPNFIGLKYFVFVPKHFVAAQIMTSGAVISHLYYMFKVHYNHGLQMTTIMFSCYHYTKYPSNLCNYQIRQIESIQHHYTPTRPAKKIFDYKKTFFF